MRLRGFHLGALMGWGVWAVIKCMDQEGCEGCGCSWSPKCLQCVGGSAPGPERPPGSRRMGLVQASGLAVLDEWVWGILSPEPGLFSLRQSSGLLWLVAGPKAAAFCPLPRSSHPEKAGVGVGWLEGKSGTVGCSCHASSPTPAPTGSAPPSSSWSGEAPPPRGPCLCRPVCLSSVGWMSVYRCLRPPEPSRSLGSAALQMMSAFGGLHSLCGSCLLDFL